MIRWKNFSKTGPEGKKRNFTGCLSLIYLQRYHTGLYRKKGILYNCFKKIDKETVRRARTAKETVRRARTAQPSKQFSFKSVKSRVGRSISFSYIEF